MTASRCQNCRMTHTPARLPAWEIMQMATMGGICLVPHREGWIAWNLGHYHEDHYGLTPHDALTALTTRRTTDEQRG